MLAVSWDSGFLRGGGGVAFSWHVIGFEDDHYKKKLGEKREPLVPLVPGLGSQVGLLLPPSTH